MTTILIVDDEQDMRNLIKVIIRQSGYQTLLAKNGFSAMDVLAKRTNRFNHSRCYDATYGWV